MRYYRYTRVRYEDGNVRQEHCVTFRYDTTLALSSAVRDKHRGRSAWCREHFGEPGERWSEAWEFQAFWFHDETDVMLFRLALSDEVSFVNATAK